MAGTAGTAGTLDSQPARRDPRLPRFRRNHDVHFADRRIELFFEFPEPFAETPLLFSFSGQQRERRFDRDRLVRLSRPAKRLEQLFLPFVRGPHAVGPFGLRLLARGSPIAERGKLGIDGANPPSPFGLRHLAFHQGLPLFFGVPPRELFFSDPLFERAPFLLLFRVQLVVVRAPFLRQVGQLVGVDDGAVRFSVFVDLGVRRPGQQNGQRNQPPDEGSNTDHPGYDTVKSKILHPVHATVPRVVVGQLPFTFRGRTRPPETRDASEAAPNPVPSDDGVARVIRVGELAGLLRNTLERRFPRVSVIGEISNLRVYPGSGHAYFTVKDRRASLACVLFAEHRNRLGFRPEDGHEVVVTGRITFYRKSGQLQLSAEHLEPVGRGALMAEYAARARALTAEGLFAPARKKSVPRFVRTVGVVTSRDGAALYDVIRTVRRRDPRARIVVSPTPVQGKSACFHIVRALARLERRKECDVILVVRGGGSLEDLWAFNEEPLVRAVAASPTPIIAGVGHESDTTLVDLAADVRASTPTAAAEQAVPVRREVAASLGALAARLTRAYGRNLDRLRVRLLRLAARLPARERLLSEPAQTLDTWTARGQRAVRRLLLDRERRLRAAEQRLTALAPAARLGRQRAAIARLDARLHPAARRALPATERVTSLSDRLGPAMTRRLEGARHRLELAERRLFDLSPRAVLDRGYAVVRTETGRVLDDARRVEAGQQLRVELARGRIRVRVEDDG